MAHSTGKQGEGWRDEGEGQVAQRLVANFATWHKLTSAAAASQLQLQLMNKTCIYAIVRGIGYLGGRIGREVGSRAHNWMQPAGGKWQHSVIQLRVSSVFATL